MALYAIGDIHGSLPALITVFDQNIIEEGDQVIFLGDYVDRGPDVRGVFDWLIEHQQNYRFEYILGNHEIMMLNARNSADQLLEWLYFGGDATLDSYGIGDDPNWADKINAGHWEFIEQCKSYLEIPPYIFVHAGLEGGKVLNEQDEYHLFWKKYVIPEQYRIDRKVICGHTSRKNGEIANFGHTVCIDTFAHGGQWLTCLNVETNEYIKASNEGRVETGKL